MNCARDRLLLILAERAAEVHGLAEPDRTPFVQTCIAKWQSDLYDAYAGDTVRFAVSAVSRESRDARDRRIVAALCAGQTPRSVAQRERVSTRLVQIVRARAAAAKPPT